MANGNYPIFADRKIQVLVNKSIDGGQADPNHWITVPAGTTAELAALERRQGSIAYDTDLDVIVYDDGTGFSSINEALSTAAEDVSYDNGSSGLAAVDVQAAIDEVSASSLDLDGATEVGSSFQLDPTAAAGAGSGSLGGNRSFGIVASWAFKANGVGDVAYSEYGLWEAATPAGVNADAALWFLNNPALNNGFAITGVNNATADANATATLAIETGNKTAGTGDSGSIKIATGTSAGGARGVVDVSALYFVIPRHAADPATGVDGAMYYNTTTDLFMGYANGAWVALH